MSVIFQRGVPSPAEYLRQIAVTKDSFGIHYVRWPYDPAVSVGGAYTSINPSRWQSELDGAIGWIRSFDPNMLGRYQGGSFVQVGTSSEGSPKPYGRIEGGTWYKGMLLSDGQYDFSKAILLRDSAQAKGLKVLMNIGQQGAYYDTVNNRYIEYPLPTGEYWTLNPTGYQTRFRDWFDAFLGAVGDGIHAIEVENEPYYWVRRDDVVGPGHGTRLAILTRIMKQLIQRRGLSILVCSPPFQGGEYNQVTAFLGTSAAGIAIDGVDGTGTTGKDWIDVFAHHNYGNFSDRGGGGSTTTMDAAGVNDPNADGAYPNNTTFADMYTKASSVRSAARAGGWTGPLWNTEYNCTGVLDDTLWYPRKMTSAGFRRVFAQLLVGSIVGGYDKHFIYAADHPTLGLYDNVGTPPAGEPADWYFKASNNTSRGATQLAAAMRDVMGLFVGGRTNANPFYSVSGNIPRVSSTSTSGQFNPLA